MSALVPWRKYALMGTIDIRERLEGLAEKVFAQLVGMQRRPV